MRLKLEDFEFEGTEAEWKLIGDKVFMDYMKFGRQVLNLQRKQTKIQERATLANVNATNQFAKAFAGGKLDLTGPGPFRP